MWGWSFCWVSGASFDRGRCVVERARSDGRRGRRGGRPAGRATQRTSRAWPGNPLGPLERLAAAAPRDAGIEGGGPTAEARVPARPSGGVSGAAGAPETGFSAASTHLTSNWRLTAACPTPASCLARRYHRRYLPRSAGGAPQVRPQLNRNPLCLNPTLVHDRVFGADTCLFPTSSPVLDL